MAVDERYLLITSKTIGADSLVDLLLSSNPSPERDLYLKAEEINKRPLKKSYLESCLLASNDTEAISEILELPKDLIDMYASVFYDVANLDKLSKLELLEVEDKSERSMKLWALSQGLEFVKWRLGLIVDINPIEGLQALFTMAIFKAKESLFSGNASEPSKEGIKWTKLSVDMARLLKVYVMDSGAAKRDIEMALSEIIPDFKSFSDLDREVVTSPKPVPMQSLDDLLGS